MYGREIPDKITGFSGTGLYGIGKCRVREYGEKAGGGNKKQATNHGIFAGPGLQLPAPECLMVKELAEGSLKTIKGIVDYSDYQYLT